MVAAAPSADIRPCSSPRTAARTWTPRAAASWVRNVPTPPAAPMSSRDCPAPTLAASSTCAAVIPAVGSTAAVFSGRPSGTKEMAASCGMTTYSAYVPVPTGGLVAWPKTASPTRKRLSPGPTTSTLPAKSEPMTSGKTCGTRPASAPSAAFQSKGFRAAYAIFTSTSPSPGSGLGTWISSASALNALTATARIRNAS